MKRYSQQQIQDLLDKFMNGLTSPEEEAALGDYFRTHQVPREWEDYRLMFDYFDRGMEGDLLTPQAPARPLVRAMGRRWWGIAAAAAITAVIVGTTVIYQPSSTSQPTVAIAAPEKRQAGKSLQTTELTPQTPTTQPVETQNLASQPAAENLASQSRSIRSTRSLRSTRRLQAQNKKLAEENERLQRELEDLKRRAFIIDLEANGFRAVQNEDGSIVLIDLEQELENELNNQLTTNIPAL